MTSQKRAAASRANGAKSHGPITPEGKKRSSQNALNNSIFSKCITLLGEPPEGIAELRNDYDERFDAANQAEQCCIDQMVAADWRLARILTAETQVLNKLLHRQPAGPNPFDFADAFEAAANSPVLALLQRTETRLQLMFQRAIRTLKLLRTIPVPIQEENTNNEPEPAPADAQPTDSEDLGRVCSISPKSRRRTRNPPPKLSVALPASPPSPKEPGGAI